MSVESSDSESVCRSLTIVFTFRIVTRVRYRVCTHDKFMAFRPILPDKSADTLEENPRAMESLCRRRERMCYPLGRTTA